MIIPIFHSKWIKSFRLTPLVDFRSNFCHFLLYSEILATIKPFPSYSLLYTMTTYQKSKNLCSCTAYKQIQQHPEPNFTVQKSKRDPLSPLWSVFLKRRTVLSIMRLSKFSTRPEQPKAHLCWDCVVGLLPMSGQALIDVFIDCNSAQGEVTENCSNEGYYQHIKFGQFN